MKATLTIEVPDDFKKGQCTGCGLWDFISPLGYPVCKYGDCPLEIQENNKFTELEEACLERIGALIVENAMLKENNQ